MPFQHPNVHCPVCLQNGGTTLLQIVVAGLAQLTHNDIATSDNRDAVMSLTSLCLIDGKPPVGHDKA